MTKDQDPVESIIESQKDFEAVVASEKGIDTQTSHDTQRKTQKVVSLLLKEDKQKLFDLIKKLNARQQYCSLAQKLLAEVLPRFTPEEVIEEFKDSRKLSEMIEAILMYSQKHYSRTDKNLKQSYFVHFVMGQMSLQDDLKPEQESAKKRDVKRKAKERRTSSFSIE